MVQIDPSPESMDTSDNTRDMPLPPLNPTAAGAIWRTRRGPETTGLPIHPMGGEVAASSGDMDPPTSCAHPIAGYPPLPRAGHPGTGPPLPRDG